MIIQAFSSFVSVCVQDCLCCDFTNNMITLDYIWCPGELDHLEGGLWAYSHASDSVGVFTGKAVLQSWCSNCKWYGHSFSALTFADLRLTQVFQVFGQTLNCLSVCLCMYVSVGVASVPNSSELRAISSLSPPFSSSLPTSPVSICRCFPGLVLVPSLQALIKLCFTWWNKSAYIKYLDVIGWSRYIDRCFTLVCLLAFPCKYNTFW